MNLQELQKKTTVYFEPGINTEPISWTIGSVNRLFGDKGVSDEVCGYMHIPEEDGMFRRIRADELPIEFFNHELLEVDAANEQSVFKFVSEWGFPFSPIRNDARCLNGVPDNFRRECIDAIVSTNELIECDMFELLIPVRTYRDAEIEVVISFEEVASTINILQDFVKTMMDAIRDKSIYLDPSPINAGSAKSNVILLGSLLVIDRNNDGLAGYGMLTSAICNQIIDSVSDSAVWRLCACEGCNRIFKRKRSGSPIPDADSIYCCKKHEERQKKRNQRKEAKNRIQH